VEKSGSARSGQLRRLYNVGTALARDGQMDAARPYLEQFLRAAPPSFYALDLKEVARLLNQPARR
jgi:hypothetical protein